jgi:TonB family protein
MAMRWSSCERRVIPSGAPKARSRGIAVIPVEGPSVGTAAIPRLAALARNDTIRRFAAPLGLTALLAAACVSTVTRYYLPDAHNPRFDTDGATKMLDQYLRVQCPERVASKKADHGDVRLTIVTDTSGAVTRAELVSSSGDEMLDGLFGTVAAQLKVDSLRATTPSAATRKLHMAYNCAPNATLATVEVLPR